MSKSIEDMTDEELFDEFTVYEQLIHDIGCYGVRDMIYHSNIQREMSKRGLRLKRKWELVK